MGSPYEYPAAAFALFLGTPTVGAVGVLAAWFCSNRDVRQTIRAGLATGYWVSPDYRWWSDGSQWVDASLAAPDAALRSPDEGYWWTGSCWIALPPRPQR